MDDRLRQFSPPPWAALGRRDPNREQAPWRESENVEDRRDISWRDWLTAKGQELATLPRRIGDDISALGARPSSPELMQRHLTEMSGLLPKERMSAFGGNPLPMHYAQSGRADGGVVEEAPERGVIERAWDARPWKDYAQNPPSMLPQLGTALGLLHPRLGSAVRDVGMARNLMNKGETPAIMRDPGVPWGAGRQLETLGAPYAARPGAQPPAGNSNAPAVMHPTQGPIMPRPENANSAPWRSAQPSGRMALYEAELKALERAGVPYSEWPSYQSFLRGLDGR